VRKPRCSIRQQVRILVCHVGTLDPAIGVDQPDCLPKTEPPRTRGLGWLSQVGQAASVNLNVAHPRPLVVVLLVCITVP
jgi:hypothetical protein